MSKSDHGGVDFKSYGEFIGSSVTGPVYNNVPDSMRELEELREKVEESLDATKEVKEKLLSFLDKLEQAEVKKNPSKIKNLVAALPDGAKDILVNLASAALQQRLGLPS